MADVTFGSVCSGIEAASVAWHPLGWRAAWLAEIEPFPSAVLAHHYPDVPNLGDMTKIADMVRAGSVPAPDVLVGGTPCQAFSVAGLRNGLADARGQLTISFFGLADAIDTTRTGAGLQPAIIVWENVPGVLSSKDNAFGCFLAGLAGESSELVAPGGKWSNAGLVHGPARTVAWRVLDAQYFGVAQRRRRVFVVASAREGFDPAAVLFEFEGVRRDTAPCREAGQEPAGTLAIRTDGGGFPGTDESCSGYVQAVEVCPTLRAGGNQTGGDRPPGTDVDTADSLIAYSVALRGRDGGATAELGDNLAGCLRASTGGGDKPHVLAPIAFDPTQITHPENRSNPQPGDPCHTLAKGGHAPAITYAIQAGAVRTNPDSGPDGVGVQTDIAYTMEARAEVQIVTYGIVDDETVMRDCLPTMPTPSASGGGHPPAVAQTGMAVRRLTPRECERLQGFPDDYTLIPWTEYQRLQKRAAKHGTSFEAELRKRGKTLRGEIHPDECPDGPRYKALGNSMAVPCMYWLGQRIDYFFTNNQNNTEHQHG